MKKMNDLVLLEEYLERKKEDVFNVDLTLSELNIISDVLLQSYNRLVDIFNNNKYELTKEKDFIEFLHKFEVVFKKINNL